MQHTPEYDVNNLQAGFELGSDPRILVGHGFQYTTTMPGEGGSSFYIFVSYDFFFFSFFLTCNFFC